MVFNYVHIRYASKKPLHTIVLRQSLTGPSAICFIWQVLPVRRPLKTMVREGFFDAYRVCMSSNYTYMYKYHTCAGSVDSINIARF